MHFEVSVAEQNGWTIVSVLGELDLATAPQLRQRIVALVSQGANRVILDLTATDFLDSIGLGVIVGALKRVQSVGGALAIATDVPRIRTVFELTGVDTIVRLYPDVASAIDHRAERADG